jgi:hypothetical protein
MRLPRFVSAGLAAAALVVIAACSQDSAPTAVRQEAPESRALLGLPLLSGSVGDVSLFSCATPGYGSVSEAIGPEGGVLRIGPHSLVIPPKSLVATTTITATAPAGDNIRVDFQPEGLEFRKPAALTLSYTACPVSPLLPQIVYVDDSNLIAELLQPVTSLFSGSVTAKLEHFSGYAIAEGRKLSSE